MDMQGKGGDAFLARKGRRFWKRAALSQQTGGKENVITEGKGGTSRCILLEEGISSKKSPYEEKPII